MRGEIEGAAAIDRVLPHHTPALRGEDRALFGACEVWGDLAAGMRVVVPGQGILELLAQSRLKSLKRNTGRHEFGFATAGRDCARRKHRRQCWTFFKRAICVPELICPIAQRKPVIGRHDLPILADRAEDYEMGTRALRTDFRYFR